MGSKQCIIYTLSRSTVNIRRGISIVRDVVYYKRPCGDIVGDPLANTATCGRGTLSKYELNTRVSIASKRQKQKN